MPEILERILTGYTYGAIATLSVIGLGYAIAAFHKHVKTCTKC
jgi:hypothetical protein